MQSRGGKTQDPGSAGAGTSQSHLLPWGYGSFSNEVTPNPLPNLPTSDF